MKEKSWSSSPTVDIHKFTKIIHKFFKVHYKTCLFIPTTPSERPFLKLPFLWP